MEDNVIKRKDFTFNNTEYIVMYRPYRERISYGIYDIPTKDTLGKVRCFGLADSVDDAINNFTTYGIRNGQ